MAWQPGSAEGVSERREQFQEDLRRRVLTLRSQAEQARTVIGATVLTREAMAQLRAIVALAQSYTPQQPASAAVYVLAQVTDRLTQFFAPWETLHAYQDAQHRLTTVEEQMYG